MENESCELGHVILMSAQVPILLLEYQILDYSSICGIYINLRSHTSIFNFFGFLHSMNISQSGKINCVSHFSKGAYVLV